MDHAKYFIFIALLTSLGDTGSFIHSFIHEHKNILINDE